MHRLSFLSEAGFVGARFYYVTQERLLPKDRMTPIQMGSDGLKFGRRGGYYDIIGSSVPCLGFVTNTKKYSTNMVHYK